MSSTEMWMCVCLHCNCLFLFFYCFFLFEFRVASDLQFVDRIRLIWINFYSNETLKWGNEHYNSCLISGYMNCPPSRTPINLSKWNVYKSLRKKINMIIINSETRINKTKFYDRKKYVIKSAWYAFSSTFLLSCCFFHSPFRLHIQLITSSCCNACITASCTMKWQQSNYFIDTWFRFEKSSICRKFI